MNHRDLTAPNQKPQAVSPVENVIAPYEAAASF